MRLPSITGKAGSADIPPLGLSATADRGDGRAKRSKKVSKKSQKTTLSVLVEQEYLLCVKQTFDGSSGTVLAVREFSIDLFEEEASRSVTLSAVLSDFVGPQKDIDAAFVYLGDALTELHRISAAGMERSDVEASIKNGSFWPNMVVTSRDLDEQAIAYDFFDLSQASGASGVGVQAAFLSSDLLSDIGKSLSTLKIDCVSVGPVNSAVSGAIMGRDGLSGAGVDVWPDGRAVIYSANAGRCVPEETFIALEKLNLEPLVDDEVDQFIGSHDTSPTIWRLDIFEGQAPERVGYFAPSNFDPEVIRSDPSQRLFAFECKLDRTGVEEQFSKISLQRRIAEASFISEYTNMICSAEPGDALRASDLNFLDRSWNLYAADRRRSALTKSFAVYGIMGLAVGLLINAGASSFLPDYVEMKLSNELVEAELTLLDSQIMQLQQEIQMLSLREEAISQIVGNHRDVYAVLISVLRTVPSQVELSRIAIDADAGNVKIEGLGSNEVLVSNFVGMLSRNGEARASLLTMSVTEGGDFQFEISIPFDELF